MASCALRECCIFWLERYLKDSVDRVRDYISLTLGFTGIISFVIAQISQIFTNFMSGCTEGVSLPFLMAWVVGDLFNLVGCLLEPSTISTQFYTALVYLISDVVLVWQTLYFDYISKWWNARKAKSSPEEEPSDHREHGNVLESGDSSADIANKIDLAESSCGCSLTSLNSRNDDGSLSNIESTSPKGSKSMLRCVTTTLFFVGGFNYFNSQAIPTFDSAKIILRTPYVLTGRKILQEASTITFRDSMIGEQSTSIVATCFAWTMAAIYMGGRFPQILKNVRRRSVEGLNPLMFLFAVITNTAYIGSIIVKTLEWKELIPKIPWLVDAAGCMILDCFILSQFLYYKTQNLDEHEDRIRQ